MANPAIVIWPGEDNWMATFIDDEAVLAAFGTDTIPAAFGVQADGQAVRDVVQARNPDCDVWLMFEGDRQDAIDLFG